MFVRTTKQITRIAMGFMAVALLLPSLTRAAPAEKFPAGSPVSGAAVFEYAIYYLPTPSKDPVAALRQTLLAMPASPKLLNQPPDNIAEPSMTARWEKDVAHKYAPPDLDALRYFGRGLSREQATALQQSQHALILDFGHSKAHIWRGLRSATEIVEKLARETGGLIWDEETREVFTPDEWRARRFDPWKSTVPNVSQHTAIHAYNNGEYVRAITLGMGKFGLPDVVVQNFSWSLNTGMGHLINAFSQSLAEGGQPARAGEYELNFRTIKDRQVRDSYLATLKPNATAVARLALLRGTPESGDPRNRLVEIGFDHYPGRDVHARQDAMLSSLFGSSDSIKRIRHDKELEAASKKARSQLPGLRKAFNAGLTPGEYIQVKAPFATPKGDTEWMWVEITEWKGNGIRGLLKNEPFDIPTLHGGQIVQVREADVFDYIRRYANGKEEGNETGKIIEKMRGAVEKNK